MTDARSPEGTFSVHLPAILDECDKLSRTAGRGVLSGESAPAKAAYLNRTGSADAIRLTGHENVAQAVFYLDQVHISAPAGARAVLVSVNREITDGLSVVPGALRTFDSDTHPYLPFPLVPRYLESLSDFIWRAMTKASAPAAESVDALARVHWDVNVRGHLFADGCGRTATVLGAWVYWAGQGVVPRLPGRERYLELAARRTLEEFTESMRKEVCPRPLCRADGPPPWRDSADTL